MAFLISDSAVIRAMNNKAKEIGADFVLYGVSDMHQYAGHITNVYFLQNGNIEIASITGLSLESALTLKELADSVQMYSRQWGDSVAAKYVRRDVV